MTAWLLKLAALISQAINGLVLGGSHDETVSGRCYRRGVRDGDPAWRKWHDRIDAVFGAGHCRASHERDLAFAAMILDQSPG